MLLLNICLAAWLSISDILYHRIPNVALIALLLVNLYILPANNFMSVISIYILLLSLSALFGLGMGDVKYIVVAFLLVGRLEYLTFTINAIYAISLWGLGAILLYRGNSMNVPIGPPISLALIITML